MNDQDHPALILGLTETGLGVARSLGKFKIKIFGFDKKIQIGFNSKYIDAKICPDPIIYREIFLDFIIDFGKSQSNKPVLFICSDEFLNILSLNQKALSKYYLINLNTDKLLTKISNKLYQYELALKVKLNVPKTYNLKDSNQIRTLIDHLSFPMILKGMEVNKWRKVCGQTKVFVVNDKKQLMDKFISLKKTNVKIIGQEIIKGPETNNYKYCAYFDQGNELASFTLQKIRQFPINFGIGCMVKSVDNSVLKNLGKDFFSNIHYTGIGSAEFKLNPADGKYYLIELNPRYWQQNYLSTACGINFPYSDYLHQTKNSVPKLKSYQLNVKWVSFGADLNSFIQHRRSGNLTLKNWIKSYTGKIVLSDYIFSDPKPFLYNLERLFSYTKVKNMLSKLFK